MWCAVLVLFLVHPVFAQHEGHQPPAKPAPATEHHPSFRIGAHAFGASREIWNTEKHSLAIGSDLTFYSKPSILDSIYGTNPVSWKVFVRLRPQKMNMSGAHGTH